MNIILVSRRRRLPRSYDLGDRRVRWRALLVLGALAIGLLGSGAGLALYLAQPDAAVLAQLRELRQQIDHQHQQLTAVHADAQRQVNALAIELGRLQAQSMRINALGERLTKLGGMDDGEFDFDQAPAVGGPDEKDGAAYVLSNDLGEGIRALGARFDQQEQQLQVLQDLLMGHKVASQQRPAGMPVANGWISSRYGRRIDPFNGTTDFHRGIDVAAKAGSAVHAVGEGVVTYAGARSGYGRVVEIDHGNGYATRYAHNSRNLVKVGQRVRVGQEIAIVGSTGRSTGPHSHFEVWYQGRTVNPLAYVRSHRG